MRFYYKRFLKLGLSVCLGVCVLVNVYNILGFAGSQSSIVWNSPSLPALVVLEEQKGTVPTDQRNPKLVEQNPVASKILRYSSAVGDIWPGDDNTHDDRIAAQIKYIPNTLLGVNATGLKGSKVILLYNGIGGLGSKSGQEQFLKQKCPVNRCYITGNRAFMDTADVVLFRHSVHSHLKRPSAKQIWALYLLESPYHTPPLSRLRDVFNWTATYRRDSTIVTPYEKFVPHNSSFPVKTQNKNYAAGKTKKVAWFVSNCGSKNQRQYVANELAEYINVDIYGACGPFKCPRFQSNHCFQLLNKDYKFYLAFENSNCIDYITEKFFVNGLQNDIIPVVMGARPEDYRLAAPPHSYIHVEDFASIKELADYLHILDQNDSLYNEYFLWKGTGTFINTYFWCRLCALAHDTNHQPSHYTDIERWWRGKGVCIGSDRWDKNEKQKSER